MKIDLAKIQPLIDEKLVSVQKHPTDNLYIYNYTQKAQFRNEWTPELLMCRGLILDSTGKVIARPYDKFFNKDQHKPEEIPLEEFVAYDKLDGSLGILYRDSRGVLQLATRGSFISDQALIGTNLLLSSMGQYGIPETIFSSRLTYLFEIIYPENRIVVDYKNVSMLVFLGARDIETGKIYTPDYFPDIKQWFESAQVVPDDGVARENAEGVVMYFKSGFMCKVKYEEYVRLHRLVTGVTARKVWECLKTGVGTKDMLERVPEEFADWVKKTTKELTSQFESIMSQTKRDYKEVIGSCTALMPIDIPVGEAFTYAEFDKINRAMKKVLNEVFTLKGHPDILLARHNKMKPEKIAEMVWDKIKPPHETPFRQAEV